MHAVLLAGADWLDSHVYNRERGWDGPRIGSLTELIG
jgi:hypothetical protein